MADFGGNSTGWVVDRAVQVQRNLIGQRTDLLEPVYYPVKRVELSFYRNQVIHIFVNEGNIYINIMFSKLYHIAILSTAMYATVKAGGPVHNQKILVSPYLENDVSFLSGLLKSEFIYGPAGLKDNLQKTIDTLTKANVFHLSEDVDENNNPTSKKWITLSNEERRIGRETFGYYYF